MKCRSSVVLHAFLGGCELTGKEWRALEETEVSSSSKSLDGTELYYEAAFEWSIVAMAQVTRSVLSARHSHATLFIAQAEDELTSVFEPSGTSLGLDGDALRQQVAAAVLRHTNMNETGRMPSFCFFHIGMSMRLTQTTEAGLITVDSVGTVVGVDFHDDELVLRNVFV